MKPLRFAIFGGSFDPIHNGHLSIARYVIEELHYKRVFFMPAYCVPLRDISPSATPRQRLVMCRLATRYKPQFNILTHELDNVTPSYLSNSIAHVQRIWHFFSKVHVIIGDDLVSELPQWHDLAYLSKWVHLIILRRSEQNEIDFTILKRLEISYTRAKNDRIGISSSFIRKEIAENGAIPNMVPHLVRRYIRTNGLYRGSASRV